MWRVEDELRVDYRVADAAGQVAERLMQLTAGMNRPLVILCIGTDRSIGDALGPLVGTHLREVGVQMPIFGTLDEPVHAGNLEETTALIHREHRQPFVIAIDGMLGRAESIGTLTVMPEPIRPGAGVGKDLGKVGNVSITGTVNVGGFMEYFVLQSTPLSRVMGMARVIAQGVAQWAEGLPLVVAREVAAGEG